MKNQISDAFHYYLDHQDEFVRLYDGKVIALKDGEVLGPYNDETEATSETLKTHRQGNVYCSTRFTRR